MTEQSGEGGELVEFTTADIMVLIGRLTNAVTLLGTSTLHLAAGRNEEAVGASNRAGEQVDAIIELLRQKLGKEIVTDER